MLRRPLYGLKVATPARFALRRDRREPRRAHETDATFRLAGADLDRFPALTPTEATVVGIAVGLLRLDLPL